MGGDGTYRWAVVGGALPTGLTLSEASGVMSGTPTTAGISMFTAEVTSGDGQNGGAPPYSWAVTAGSLPTGLSLNTISGVISGTPVADGTSTITVRVESGDGQTASADLSIPIG